MIALELCEKVLAADKTWKQSCDCCVTYPCGKVAGKCEWVFTDAAPLLARIVRCYHDAILVMTKDGATDAIEIKLKEYAYAILEEADRIAKGET